MCPAHAMLGGFPVDRLVTRVLVTASYLPSLACISLKLEPMQRPLFNVIHVFFWATMHILSHLEHFEMFDGTRFDSHRGLENFHWIRAKTFLSGHECHHVVRRSFMCLNVNVSIYGRKKSIFFFISGVLKMRVSIVFMISNTQENTTVLL